MIEITDGAGLDDVRTDLAEDYVLANDIESSGLDPIGDETDPFEGTFDGQGHTIDLTQDQVDAGIFGWIDSGSVSDLRINADIDCDNHTGALSGEIHGSTVSNIELTGSINAGNSVASLCDTAHETPITDVVSDMELVADPGSGGGICSILSSGHAERCFFSGSISATGLAAGIMDNVYDGASMSQCGFEGSISTSGSGFFISGIANFTRNFIEAPDPSIEDCYAVGRQSAPLGFNAALIGQAEGVVARCFAAILIDSGVDSGAIQILEDDATGIDSVYYDDEIADYDFAYDEDSSTGDTDEIIASETSEMTGIRAAFEIDGLDFEDAFVTTANYPDLRWRHSHGPGEPFQTPRGASFGRDEAGL